MVQKPQASTPPASLEFHTGQPICASRLVTLLVQCLQVCDSAWYVLVGQSLGWVCAWESVILLGHAHQTPASTRQLGLPAGGVQRS